MRYAALVERLANEGERAWEVHERALRHRRQGGDVVLLSIGDPDFDTPAAIAEALVERLRAGDTHYGAIDGSLELKAAIAAFHARHGGGQAGPEHVSVTLGAQGALYGALMCIAQAGDEVVVPQPAYVTYDSVVQASGAVPVAVALRPEHGFRLDAGDIAAAVTDRTRAILVNTPHNPSGAVATRAELEALAALCRRRGLWLVCDEVYGRTLFDGRRHLSPRALPGMAERTIVADSLSKSHAMTGWRIGWTVGPPAFARHMYRLGLALHYGPPTFVQAAALAAFSGTFPEVEAMRARYQARRDLVCEALAGRRGIRALAPQGGCFMMVDVRASGLASQVFAERLLDEAGVAVLAGEGFGAAGFVRLSLTAPEDDLVRAAARIARFAEALAPPG